MLAELHVCLPAHRSQVVIPEELPIYANQQPLTREPAAQPAPNAAGTAVMSGTPSEKLRQRVCGRPYSRVGTAGAGAAAAQSLLTFVSHDAWWRPAGNPIAPPPPLAKRPAEPARQRNRAFISSVPSRSTAEPALRSAGTPRYCRNAPTCATSSSSASRTWSARICWSSPARRP